MVQERVLLDAGISGEQVQRLKTAWDEFQRVKARPRREIPCVVCAGIYNAGKSTLLNALTEREDEYFPTGDVPTTREVKQLEYQGAVYIDTPGLNADAEDDAETRRAYESADYILFVNNTKDGGISAKEAEWLCRMRDRYTQEGFRQRLIYVLSQSDQVADEDLPGIRDRAVQDFEKALGFAPDPVFTVDSISWQEGQRDGNPTALEESGIPALRSYLLTKTAEAKETLARAEQAELDTRRQTLFESLADIHKVCKTAQEKDAQDTQSKLAELDKAWSTFEAELEKAMPEETVTAVGMAIYNHSDDYGWDGFRAKAKGSSCRSEATGDVRDKLRRLYDRYGSIVRDLAENAVIRRTSKSYLSAGMNSEYFSICDRINQIFSQCVLSINKKNSDLPLEKGNEIKVSVSIPDYFEDSLIDTYASSLNHKQSFGEYASMINGYSDDRYEERRGLFGTVEVTIKGYSADGGNAANRINSHINDDLLRGREKANNMFNRDVWHPFYSELKSQVSTRKAALKQQVDAYRSRLRSGTGDEKITAALSHLDTLSREARA